MEGGGMVQSTFGERIDLRGTGRKPQVLGSMQCGTRKECDMERWIRAGGFGWRAPRVLPDDRRGPGLGRAEGLRRNRRELRLLR